MQGTTRGLGAQVMKGDKMEPNRLLRDLVGTAQDYGVQLGGRSASVDDNGIDWNLYVRTMVGLYCYEAVSDCEP